MKEKVFDFILKFAPITYGSLLLAGIILYRDVGMNSVLVSALIFSGLATVGVLVLGKK